MRGKFVTVGAALAVILAVGIFVSRAGDASRTEPIESVFESFTIRSVQAADGDTSVFSQTSAEARARAAAVAYLVAPDGPSLPSRGITVRESDLETREAVFAAGATEVRFSSTKSVSTYPAPTNLWVFVFQLRGVRAVEVELEDGTGAVKGVGIFLDD
jgi:hypothetical protein